MVCKICNGYKVVRDKERVGQCICVRQDEIRERLGKKVSGELKFLNPSSFRRVKDLAFIQMGLPEFKDHLAGYLLHKRSFTYELMTISEYFAYRLENSDDGDLLNRDLMILNYSMIYPNKVVPLYIMQLCTDRATRGKKTWMISSEKKETLEWGYRESKDLFVEFLSKIPRYIYKNDRFKKQEARTELAKKGNWKNQLK